MAYSDVRRPKMPVLPAGHASFVVESLMAQTINPPGA
jgi:hypothetical protein